MMMLKSSRRESFLPSPACRYFNSGSKKSDIRKGNFSAAILITLSSWNNFSDMWSWTWYLNNKDTQGFHGKTFISLGPLNNESNIFPILRSQANVLFISQIKPWNYTLVFYTCEKLFFFLFCCLFVLFFCRHLLVSLNHNILSVWWKEKYRSCFHGSVLWRHRAHYRNATNSV